MKKSILIAAVLAFALTNALPASAVRGKEKGAAKGAQSKAAVASDRSVQSSKAATAKGATASKAAAASAKSSAAK